MTFWLAAILVAGFIGYHVYRRSAAKPFPQDPSAAWQPGLPSPQVSFLVPAWKAAGDIEAFVTAFRALGYPHKELVLCVGGDGGYALAKALEGEDVRVLEQKPGQGKQGALRDALPFASGEILYLTDIDCRPCDAAVNALLLPLLRDEAQVATGSIRPLSEQLGNAFVVSHWAVERVTARRAGECSEGLRGANTALRREALRATGNFSQEAPSGTDYTLAKELRSRGYRIAHVRSSEMPTEYPADLGLYVRKQARWLRNVAVLGLRYRMWREIASVGRTLAVPFVVIALAVAGIRYWPLVLLALSMVAHAVLNRLYYVRLSGLRSTPGAALSAVLGDLGAGILATSQFLRKRMTWS